MTRRLLAVTLASLLAGCTVLRQLGTPASTPIRVATYNIRHGVGMDDALRLERTAATLRGIDADLIGLQEVDSAVRRSDGVDQARVLGDLLGMQSAFGAFMPYQGGAYGMAILSRWPIVRTTSLRLPEGNEPRVALVAEVEQPGGTRLTVVNVHFDWVEDDEFRYAQARVVRAMLDTLSTPWVLLGDFNDEPGSRTLRLLMRAGDEATKPDSAHLTFPAAPAPIKEIDFIVAGPRGRWRVGNAMVVDERVASDHRPVTATLIRER
jgi:endonuclease/exonuclease/phosphatase family metal-dependent hydrolase